MAPAQRTAPSGLVFGVSAYLLWGVLPLYFVALGAIGPFEIVAGRVVLTLIFCAVAVTVLRQWGPTAALLRDRGVLLRLAAAAAVIYVNWQVFVVASTTGHIIDASLGYFINPVVTILLAVLFMHERLTPVQWAAVGLTVVAFAIIAIGYGIFPWTGLILALSFGCYGYLKSSVGDRVPALGGLFVESLVLTPFAIAILSLLGIVTGLSIADADPVTVILFAGSGAVTAVPLLCFAAAARRIPLSVLGFLQYLAPSLMFLQGWLLLGEAVPPARWAGFGLVWLALVCLSFDTVRRARRERRLRRLG